MTYEAVIGLETHAELMTQSKMFCGCAVVDSVSAPPNTAVCEVCAGMPGTLPVINARAVEFALRVALALHCEIQPLSVFARKNYFYPDLPKGYQISQYELPLALRGWIDIDTPAGPRRVRIRRVHLEEDTGKLTHQDDGRSTMDDGTSSIVDRPSSLVDLNRAGVPLLEVVTEPDLHTPEEVKAYAVALRSLMRYLGVNSGDMEKGILRFEPNISVRPVGSSELRTRTELKNLNSFRVLERGTAYEIERQTQVWESGGEVLQETRGWNEARNETVGQRGKEHAHDYRYFPEPDLPPLQLTPEGIERVRASLPELPAAKRDRFIRDYGLSPYDAGVLVAEQAVAAYFEAAVGATEDGGRRTDDGPSSVLHPPSSAKPLANWITGELFRLMNRDGVEIGAIKVGPEALAGLHKLVAAGTINTGTAKTVLEAMVATGQDARALVDARGLAQISDTGAIDALIDEVLANHPDQVQTYLGGKASVEQWFFGQVMKGLKGRGNPALIRESLAAKLQQFGGPDGRLRA